MAGSDRDPWPARLAFIATSAALATVVWGAVTAADRPSVPAVAPAEARPAAADVRGFQGSEVVPAAADVRGSEGSEAKSDRDRDDRDHEEDVDREEDRGRESGREGERDRDDEDEHRPSAPALRTRGS